jgi:hypothetical protein
LPPRHQAPLIGRVLDRLEAQLQADRVLRKTRAVADRRHRGVRGDEMFVDDHAIFAHEARGARQPILGEDANADDDDVGGQSLAVCEHNGFDEASRALDRRNADAETEGRAEGPVRVKEEGRSQVRHGAAERSIGDLDHRHFAAQRQRGGGDLQADEAGANDDDPLARAEPLADRLRVGDVA